MLRCLSRLFLGLPLFFSACGYKNVEIRDYWVYLDTDDASIAKETRRLVYYYNQEIGLEALKITDKKENANSAMIWTSHLSDAGGKIGYGRWESRTEQDSKFISVLGQRPTRTVNYSMDVEFDREFFVERMSQAKTSAQWQELFVLFCHEVGHGLTLEHDPDPKNVMYKYIEGADGVKFTEYFSRARGFFAGPGKAEP